MTDEDHLQELKKRMSQTPGHLTRWRRFCAERKATTVEEEITCAEEALFTPHSDSWAEGMRDSFVLREIELQELFGGEIPDDI